jgi:hypothetical protein
MPYALAFVAGREDDAGPDDHGATAQSRVITLLDGRIEGIDVGMQDRPLLGHEQMFASGTDIRDRGHATGGAGAGRHG